MAEQETRTGGTQAGGGPSQSDMAAPGGSSGSGGYGNAQNQANHQGQETRPSGHDMSQSRGELFDEQQGGGRDSESVSDDSDGNSDETQQQGNRLDDAVDELLRDPEQHQDRGQNQADFERDPDS